ncbi:MAG: hypothetical protein ACRD8W_00955 [Nitrososphaeraceae archaeon]
MITKPSVIIGMILVTLLAVPTGVFASVNDRRDLSEEQRESRLYNENGYVISNRDRPPINPDFAPDESCFEGEFG